MNPPHVVKPRFILDARSLAEIQRRKIAAEKELGEVNLLPSISWGEIIKQNKSLGEGIIIGFYSDKQREEVQLIVSMFDGCEIAVFMMNEKIVEFSSQTISYEEDKGFYFKGP